MLLIPCPWCGPRDEAEFHYGGQAHVAYPADPAALSRRRVGPVPVLPRQPEGAVRRALVHTAGCRRWFNAVRDTATHEFLAVYRIGEPRPVLPRGRRSAIEARELATGGRIDRDQPSCAFSFDGARLLTGLPRRHAGLGAARQRRRTGSRPASRYGRPRGHLRRRGRGAERAGADRAPVPRADADRHDGRAVRRAGGHAAWPGRARWPTRPTRRATTRCTRTATCWWSAPARRAWRRR